MNTFHATLKPGCQAPSASIRIRLLTLTRRALTAICLLGLAPLWPCTSLAQNPGEPAQADPYSPQAYKAAERHKAVRIVAVGAGAQRSYIFAPHEASAKDLPLVIFLHGWQGTNPKNFGALIDHLVLRGSVVLYPVYQRDAEDDPQAITSRADKSLQAALEWLERERPGLVRQGKALYFGFSMGASMAVNLAARTAKGQLPQPYALLLSAPGDAHHVHRGARSMVERSPAQLPLSIPMILMTGSEDTTIGVPTAYAYWNAICSQRRRNKTLVLFPAGTSGTQVIRSMHGMPGAPDPRYDLPDIDAPLPDTVLVAQDAIASNPSLNVLDFHGHWKIITGAFDGLRDGHEPPQWLFVDSAQLRHLGAFSDGSPFPPSHLERTCPARPGR